ncbi:MAG: CsgG/HfaB family protein [Pseudolabrys sp.]
MRSHVRKYRSGLRIGVNDFVDGTGVMEGGTQYSRALSQRPDMMMVVALASAGAHLVNRSSVNVAEWEMKQAMEKKLGDGRKEMVDGQSITFRPIRSGVILGSTDYVSGAITELNWNISSGVAEGGAYSAAIGKRTYRISLAIDVMVTNTQTTEIVYAKSFKKQLVGFETNANFFRFVNQNTALQIVSLGNAATATATQALELFDANLGEKQNEPTQVALRWVVELTAYDIMRRLTHAGTKCDALLPKGTFDDEPPVVTAGAMLSGASAAVPVNDQAASVPDKQAVASKQEAAASPTKKVAAAALDKAAAPAPVKVAAVPVEKAVEPPPNKIVATAFEKKPVAAREPVMAKSTAKSKVPTERAMKTADVGAAAAKHRVVEARAELPASKPAKATKVKVAEKPGKKRRQHAQSRKGGANIRWMAGSVPALQPEWSRFGQAGSTQ